jgi:hypothetical protein
VLFKLLSIDASLSSLEVDTGELDPPFDPLQLSYTVILPQGTTQAPGVTCTTSDENASVEVEPATDVTSFIKDLRTTKIMVTAELGTPSITYEIVFDVAESISGSEFAPMVRIYPNPFTDHTTISISDAVQTQKIELIDMYGRIIRTIDNVKSTSITINREDLPGGIYIVRIYAEDTYVRKVMIR